MNVLFLRSNSVNPDPRVEKEVKSLSQYGFNCSIACWEREENHRAQMSMIQINSQKIDITRFGIKAGYGVGFKKNSIPLIKFMFSLHHWLNINKNSYDVIHACDLQTAIVGYLWARKYNKKFIYDVFDYYVDSFTLPKLLKKQIESLDINLINKANATIICSEKRRQQIKKANPKKIAIIHNSPNYCNFENVKSINNLGKPQNIKLVYIGGLVTDRFLKELAEVVIGKKNCELHVGGYGVLERYFIELAEKEENIFYYGKLNYTEALQLEESCDLMTAIYNPSIKNHYYAAPNKFYEALMLGKPVIMIENTGMSEVVKRNGIGKVIKYTKEDLSRAIDELIIEKETWDFIANKMKKIYFEKYNWNIMEKRLLKLYQTI